MRIGFDAKRAFCNSTGLGSYSRHLLDALVESQGHHKYFLYTPKANSSLYQSSQRVIGPQTRLGKVFSSSWRIWKMGSAASHDELDLFHGLSQEIPFGLSKYKIPSVITLHDLISWKFPEWFSPIDRNVYRLKVQYAAKHASMILAVSEQSKRDAIELLKLPSEKVQVIPPICSPLFMPSDGPLENFFVSVGISHERKNGKALIEAFDLFCKTNPSLDFKLKIVCADNSYVAGLKRLAIAQVEFLHNVSLPELVNLYRSAWASIYVSLFEGFGMPIVESLACGTPVIASSTSSCPEAMGGGGLSVEPYDVEAIAGAMGQIVDTELRAGLRREGLDHARKFTPSVIAEKWNEVYQTVVQS